MYKSLDILPYKIFIQILETGNTTLLSKEEIEFTEIDLQIFEVVWNKIYIQYLELKPNDNDKRVLNIHREIAYLEVKYNHIKMILECLIFDWDQNMVNVILDYGFTLTDKNYYKDLEIIDRESESIISNIEMFKSQLPKEKEEKQNKDKTNIDFVLASYSAILGIDFDYNLASVTKVLGLQIQVDAKIKSLEKQ